MIDVIKNIILGSIGSLLAFIILKIINDIIAKQVVLNNSVCNDIMAALYPCLVLYENEKINTDSSEINPEVFIKIYDRYDKVDERKSILAEHLYDTTVRITSEKNKVLLESIKTCFFLYLNSKLLDLVNEINNQIPMLKEQHKNLIKEYQAIKNNDEKQRFGWHLFCYIDDINYLISKWKELLTYIGYDSKEHDNNCIRANKNLAKYKTFSTFNCRTNVRESLYYFWCNRDEILKDIEKREKDQNNLKETSN